MTRPFIKNGLPVFGFGVSDSFQPNLSKYMVRKLFGYVKGTCDNRV